MTIRQRLARGVGRVPRLRRVEARVAVAARRGGLAEVREQLHAPALGRLAQAEQPVELGNLELVLTAEDLEADLLQQVDYFALAMDAQRMHGRLSDRRFYIRGGDSRIDGPGVPLRVPPWAFAALSRERASFPCRRRPGPLSAGTGDDADARSPLW